jgi:hypothetical protein
LAGSLVGSALIGDPVVAALMEENSCLKMGFDALALGGSMYLGILSAVNLASYDVVGSLTIFFDYAAKLAGLSYNAVDCALHDPWISNNQVKSQEMKIAGMALNWTNSASSLTVAVADVLGQRYIASIFDFANFVRFTLLESIDLFLV